MRVTEDKTGSTAVVLLSFFPVCRLKPFTSYQFRVKATNDIGDSEYSKESEAITTLQDGRGNCETL